MRKVITLSLLSVLSIFILSGCISEPSPESHTGTIEKKHMTQKEIHNIIKKAAEDAGWSITEFKSNALIAEKYEDKDSSSFTITFNKSSFDITPENSELESIIDSALE